MRKFNSLILVFIFLTALPALAQKKWQFITSKKVGYLKNSDEQLEKVLRKWNEAAAPSADLRYHYNTADLNGDGKADAIVFVSGNSICGTGGCQVLIFKGDGKNYALVTEMSVSHPPVFVGATKTNGWRDLVMEVYGGGIKPYFASLKFDGKTYPENPTVELALPKKSKAKFIEYLSGIEDYETGFELR